MSHLLLLPETPRPRCVGTPVFTGENTLALFDCCLYVCVCACMYVCGVCACLRGRDLCNHNSPKRTARPLMNSLNSIALQRRGLMSFIKLVEDGISS